MRFSKISLAGAVAAAMLVVTSNGYSDATPATGSVSGTVTTQDQKPAVGVIVRINVDTKVKKAADDTPKKKKAPGLMATTDDKGTFKIENVPEGQYVVSAIAKDVGKAKSTVAVTAGKNVDVTLQLVPVKKKV